MSDSYKNNNINLKDLFHFALTKWKIFAVLAVFFVAAAAIIGNPALRFCGKDLHNK